MAAGVVVAGVLAVGGIAFATRDTGDDAGHGNHGGTPTSAATTRRPTTNPTTNPPTTTKPSPNVPPDEQCTDEIKQNEKWVCLTKATFDGEEITIEYQANWAGATPNVNGGYHLHIYGGDGTNPPDEDMGTQSQTPGSWYVEDQDPSVRKATSQDFKEAIGTDVPKVCARIADGDHALVPDANGTFHTGNCVPITRI
jgi:hypothetical protein